MKDGDTISPVTFLIVLLSVFCGCLWLLLGSDLDPSDFLSRSVRGDEIVDRPSANEPRQWESEYDFEAYYAEKERQSSEGADEEPSQGSKRGARVRSPRQPDLPEGLEPHRGSTKEQHGIEIVDIGGSLTPVDAYEESGGIVARTPGTVVATNRYWPMPAQISSVAQSVPQVATYQEAAAYIAQNESETAARVKAINDYIGLRLEYDYAALRTKSFPNQSPTAVFARRTAVCAGYAQLFRAMATEMGIEAVYVRGKSRQWMEGRVSDLGHAWNAVKVDGEWYLVDPTWGDDDQGRYTTDYLFVPGEVLGSTHLPSQRRWQLREQPLTAQQFARAPHLRPGFFAEGLDLLSPNRGEITVSENAVVEVANPAGRTLAASIKPRGGGRGQACKMRGAGTVRIVCPTAVGRHTIVMWSGPSRRDLKFVAAIHVTR